MLDEQIAIQNKIIEKYPSLIQPFFEKEAIYRRLYSDTFHFIFYNSGFFYICKICSIIHQNVKKYLSDEFEFIVVSGNFRFGESDC